MSTNSPESPTTTTGVSTGTKVRNLLIVLVAVALSVALFIGLRTDKNSVSLSTLAEQSTPYEVAMSNGKPTLVEFYADWCTVCQSMAPDIAQLEQQYGEKVNFAMLNVDNNKWLPEMLKYKVDGIPHFVYLTKDGEATGQAIGLQPRSIIANNIEALVSGSSLTQTQTTGEVSKFQTPVTTTNSQDDPRSHGSQVKS